MIDPEKACHFVRRLILFSMLLSLASCGSSLLPDPIGIGTDRDQLKQSPCACREIPQNYGTPS